MRTIRIGGFFSGIGAHHSAVNRIAAQRADLDFKVIFQCEINDKTATAYDLMHGEIRNLKDVTQVNDIGGDLTVDKCYYLSEERIEGMIWQCPKDSDVIVAAILNSDVYKGHEQIRRIYSIYGNAPTITAGGGTHTPKILVVDDENEETY